MLLGPSSLRERGERPPRRGNRPITLGHGPRVFCRARVGLPSRATVVRRGDVALHVCMRPRADAARGAEPLAPLRHGAVRVRAGFCPTLDRVLHMLRRHEFCDTRGRLSGAARGVATDGAGMRRGMLMSDLLGRGVAMVGNEALRYYAGAVRQPARPVHHAQLLRWLRLLRMLYLLCRRLRLLRQLP